MKAKTLAELAAEFDRMIHHAELFSGISMLAHVESLSGDEMPHLLEQRELALDNLELFAGDVVEYERLRTVLEFIDRQIESLRHRTKRG